MAIDNRSSSITSAIRNTVSWLYNAIYEPISPAPLAAFRIAFGLVILAEFLHLLYKRDLYFLEFLLYSQIPLSIYWNLFAWAIAIICLISGFLTPLATFITYRYIIYFFRSSVFCYHADMIYVQAAFLMIFLPLNRCWSIDSWIFKRYFHKDLSQFPIPRIYNNLLLLYACGFMYFDSSIYKCQSPFWLEGLGFWVPVSFPSFTTFDWNFVLNQEFLVRLAGYLTLFFELAFVFLLWIPGLRIYLFIIGLILHTGIGIALPIPLFGLVMLTLYLNFFPDSNLNRFIHFPPCTGYSLLKFDLCMSKFLMALITIFALIQLTVTFDHPIFASHFMTWIQDNAGITKHAVFGQWQFTTMKNDVALAFYDKVGKERWIPCVTKEGYTGSEVYGRFWTFWWLASLPGNPKRTEQWARVAEAWAKREEYKLEEGYVLVKAKPLITRLKWEQDRYEKQKQIPWSDVLKISWSQGQRHFQKL